MSARLVLALLVAAACDTTPRQDSAWTPPAAPVAPPRRPEGPGTVQPAPQPEAKPESQPDVSPAPSARLRLIVPASKGEVVVRVDGKIVQATRRTRRQANEGVAHLVILTGSPTTERQLAALPGLTSSEVMADRFGLGVIDGEGFRLLSPFTSDPGLLIPAARTLPTRSEDSPEPEVALYQGLLDAMLTFRGERELPATHVLTLLSDGVDTAVRRRSVLERLASGVQSRAAAYEVMPRLLLFGESGAAHAALTSLITTSGGLVQVVAPPAAALLPTSPAAAAERARVELEGWRTAVEGLRQDFEVLDVAAALTPGGVVPVEVQAGAMRWTRELRGPEDGDGSSWPMAIPVASERVLPLGMTSVDETRGLARRAASGGDALRAGALWHLVSDAAPESRQAHDEANQWDNRFRSAGAPIGTLVRGAQRHPTEFPVRVDLQFIHEELRERGSGPSAAQLMPPRRQASPVEGGPPAEASPPITQLLLVGCIGGTAERCARDLLARRRWAHLVLDDRGDVTQLADLAGAVAGGPPDVESVVVALTAPPHGASTDPLAPHRAFALDSRQARNFAGDLIPTPVPDLLPAQVRALIPLLHSLGHAVDGLKLRFPKDDSLTVTRAQLADQKAFVGLVLESNASANPGECPGLPATLERLARAARKLEIRSQSTDMESWVDALGTSGVREGAALRFSRVGEVAIPLLIEVGDDARLDTLEGVVLALRWVGFTLTAEARAPITSAFASWLGTLEGRGPAIETGGATIEGLEVSLVEGLLELGGAVPEDLTRRWLEEPVGAPPKRLTRPNALLAAQALLTAKPTAPRALLLLQHEEPLVRAAAVQALSGDDLKLKAGELVTSTDPWIRYLAAAGLPAADAVQALSSLHELLPTRTLVSALRERSPDAAVLGLASWFESAPDADSAVIAEAFVAWRQLDVIRVLAPRLDELPPRRREQALALFRAVSGRDLGGAAHGWLDWLARKKHKPTDP